MQLLRIDWNVLFTIINLLVLYLLLKKFLIGPVTGIMKQRQELIDGQLAEAADTKKAAGELKEQYETMIAGAKEESEQLIQKARKEAQKEYDAKIDAADVQAEKIIKNANQAVELEREKTIQDLQTQIAGLAIAAAGKVLGEADMENSNSQLYQKFITGEK